MARLRLECTNWFGFGFRFRFWFWVRYSLRFDRGGRHLFRLLSDRAVQFGEAADRGEVVGGEREDVFEFGARVGVLTKLLQRAAQRDAGRQVRRMTIESGAACGHGVFETPGAAVLFGERAESDGRRILTDPALQFFDPRQHAASDGYEPAVTVIARVTEELLFSLSVTVSVTKYVPAAVKSCSTMA